MNLNEYQRLALRTSGAGHDRVKNGCLGLIGESGEIVDIVKKYMFQSGENPPFPKDKFIKEMGDVLWYCAETVSGMELELGTVLSPEKLYRLAGNTDVEFVAVMLSVQAAHVYNDFFYCHETEAALYGICNIYSALLRLCDLIGTTIDEVADTNIEKLKSATRTASILRGASTGPNINTKNRKNVSESASEHLFEMRNKTV